MNGQGGQNLRSSIFLSHCYCSCIRDLLTPPTFLRAAVQFSFLNLISNPLSFLPVAYSSLSQARGCITRIANFMLLPERESEDELKPVTSEGATGQLQSLSPSSHPPSLSTLSATVSGRGRALAPYRFFVQWAISLLRADDVFVAIRHGNFLWAEPPDLPPTLAELRVRINVHKELMAEWKRRARRVWQRSLLVYFTTRGICPPDGAWTAPARQAPAPRADPACCCAS